MKRIIAVLIALFLLALPVSAQEKIDEISLSYTEGLTVCSRENIPSADGKIFGMNESDFKKYLVENNILIYAMDQNNAFAFEISGEETAFTRGVGSFSNISEADINDFAQKALVSVYSIEKIEGYTYIVADSVSDSKSNYVTRQYITVNNGVLYVTTFTVPGNSVKKEVSDRMVKIIRGIKFASEKAPENVSLFSVIGVAVLVVLVSGFAVYILVTVIRDIKKRKREPEEAEM